MGWANPVNLTQPKKPNLIGYDWFFLYKYKHNLYHGSWKSNQFNRKLHSLQTQTKIAKICVEFGPFFYSTMWFGLRFLF